MTTELLDVLIAGERAGTLTQGDSGSLSFRYLKDYRGVPLSSAMPLSTRTYRDKTVEPYLWGLLPEDLEVRRDVARGTGVSPNNPFALLGIIGLDCPGAVQFCQQGLDVSRDDWLVEIDDVEIARRLSQGRAGGRGWVTGNERWSLGGQQSKYALRYQDGRWFSCEGAAATTHILKSGISGLSHQALNEYVCLMLASRLGIPAAKVEYRTFEEEPAIVVARYDRHFEGGSVIRLHQEDLCQALSCLPVKKNAMDGGPTCSDILGFLMTTGSVAQENIAKFLQMLLFNYLIAGTDAHAKNYSVLLDADGGHRLAPMYDVASVAPYIESARWKAKPPKLAMSIGGENRVGCVSMDSIRRMVDRCCLEDMGVTAEGIANLLRVYADAIPEKLAEVFDDLERTEFADATKDLREHMEGPVEWLCHRAVDRL